MPESGLAATPASRTFSAFNARSLGRAVADNPAPLREQVLGGARRPPGHDQDRALQQAALPGLPRGGGHAGNLLERRVRLVGHQQEPAHWDTEHLELDGLAERPGAPGVACPSIDPAEQCSPPRSWGRSAGCSRPPAAPSPDRPCQGTPGPGSELRPFSPPAPPQAVRAAITIAATSTWQVLNSIALPSHRFGFKEIIDHTIDRLFLEAC